MPICQEERKNFYILFILESVLFIHQMSSIGPGSGVRYALNAAEPSGQYLNDISVNNDEHVKTCLYVQVCLHM